MNSESDVLEYWNKDKSFKKSLDMNRGKEEYVFYDGPPFATGLPHYGHILGSFIKDTVPRFKTQQGFYVERKWGWDCHGLPVEHEVDKQLGFSKVSAIEKFGLSMYNQVCRNTVLKFSQDWKVTIERIGRWVEFDNSYKTMDLSYMEKVWSIFKELYEHGYVYMSQKVMPYSVGCATVLSNQEAKSNMTEIRDSSLIVKFKIVGLDNTYFLVYTTTPWTLPSNSALCVSKNGQYAEVEIKSQLSHDKYILLVTKVSTYFKNVQPVRFFSGHDLMKFKYEYYWQKDCYGSVICDEYVESEKGTGIVHLSPIYGMEDADICQKHSDLPQRVDYLDEHGFVTDKCSFRQLEGQYFKDADNDIIRYVMEQGLCFSSKQATHMYPFCPRSDSPIIFRPQECVFLDVNKVRKRMQEINKDINWQPDYLKEKRFGKWLQNDVDWCLSRSRFWGTPIPLYFNSDKSQTLVVGSIAELEQLTNTKISDLHRDHIDLLILNNGFKRVPYVFDCWFESGCMPYCSSQQPYPPADFIAEGIDQIRGWFYSLHVLSTMLYDRPAFKNVKVNGLILAEDGQKMAKRKKNFPDPQLMLDKYGSDCLRLYLLGSSVTNAENFKFEEKGLKTVVKQLNTLRNCLSFLESTTYFTNPQPLTNLTLIDKWILNQFNEFQKNFHCQLDKFNFPSAIRSLYNYIDLLSHWYLKLSKNSPTLTPVLAVILKSFSIVTAALIPFTSEIIYSRFDKCSVHTILYQSVPSIYFPDTHIDLTQFIKIIEFIRQHRQYPHKMPLHSVVISTKSTNDYQQLIQLSTYLEKELNVKSLTICQNYDEYVKTEFTLNTTAIRKKFKKLSALILSNLPSTPLHPNMEIEIENNIYVLDETCFTTQTTTDGLLLDNVYIKLDQSCDQDSINTFWKATLNRLYQTTRKNAQLKPQQLVHYSFVYENDEIGTSLQLLEPTIALSTINFSSTHKIVHYQNKKLVTTITVNLEYLF